jgi:hypothetical protein
MAKNVAVRWEREELDRSRSRGVWDRWSVQDAERRDDWLFFAFDKRRIYAPLEHPELPHQFASAARSDAALLTFVRAYGRLGWHELWRDERVGRSSWLQQTLRIWESAVDREGVGAFNAEPIEWIKAHAHTVAWCLQAGLALQITHAGSRTARCRELSRSLPKPLGCRAWIRAEPLLGEKTISKVSPVHFVGARLEDYLWINLEGVRRRVQYDGTQLQASWGGDSLLESIYTMVTDAATGGRLSQCQACGAVFLQTDERQRFCPPREGQEKSACMNRERVRRYRQKERSGHGKTTRAR